MLDCYLSYNLYSYLCKKTGHVSVEPMQFVFSCEGIARPEPDILQAVQVNPYGNNLNKVSLKTAFR